MSKITKLIQWHIDVAHSEAIREVERLARAILVAHGNLDEFIMAMGGALFTVKGSIDNLGLDDRAYFKPLRVLIEEFDDALGITGTPMRFTADGPTKKVW